MTSPGPDNPYLWSESHRAKPPSLSSLWRQLTADGLPEGFRREVALSCFSSSHPYLEGALHAGCRNRAAEHLALLLDPEHQHKAETIARRTAQTVQRRKQEVPPLRCQPGPPSGLLGRLGELAFLHRLRPYLDEGWFQVRETTNEGGFSDLQLFDGEQLLLSINIKTQGSLFRNAAEQAGIPPQYCWAWASYKVLGSLNQPQAHHVAAVLPLARFAPGLQPERLWSLLNSEEQDVLCLLSSLALPRRLEDRFADEILSRDSDGQPLWQRLWQRHPHLPSPDEIPFRMISACEAADQFFDPQRNCQSYKRTNIRTQPNLHLHLGQDGAEMADWMQVICNPQSRAELLQKLETRRARLHGMLFPSPPETSDVHLLGLRPAS